MRWGSSKEEDESGSLIVIIHVSLIVGQGVDADDDGPAFALKGTGQADGQVNLLDTVAGFQVPGVELGPAAFRGQPGAAQRAPLEIGDGQAALGVGAAVGAAA